MASMSLTKTQKEAATLRSRLANIRRSMKEGADDVQTTFVTAGGALGSAFVAHKFFKSAGETKPTVKGLPVLPMMAVAGIGAGVLTDSDFLKNVGKGALYVAAGEMGRDLAG